MRSRPQNASVKPPTEPMTPFARGSHKHARWIVMVLTLAWLASVTAHPGMHADGSIPISPESAAALQADLDAGAVLPVDLVCDIDGALVSVTADPDPPTSGLHGVVVVSGQPIRVPASVPIQVGDTQGDNTAFENLTATPSGYPSFLGHGVSVTGLLELVPDTGSGAHVVCTASSFLLEVGHPPIIGVVTDNGPGGLFVNGVRIVPNEDPRIAPFVRIRDLAGAVIQIEEIPLGKLVSVGGDYDAENNTIVALLIELDSILPPVPGENDHVSILRAEARAARNEIRVRGFANNATATVSLHDYTGGTQGVLLANGIAIAPADGVWEFRGTFAPVGTSSGAPEQILATTENGGFATAFVTIR